MTESVSFIVRTDTGSQGVTAMDVQDALAEAFSYDRSRVDVRESKIEEDLFELICFERDKAERSLREFRRGLSFWQQRAEKAEKRLRVYERNG